MYKHILENAGDISAMALIPLVIFFLVFMGSLIMTFINNTQDMEQMSRLPFEDALSERIENEIKS